MRDIGINDFRVRQIGAAIVATHLPSESYLSFPILCHQEWPQRGRLSQLPKIRHADSGAFEGYDLQAVVRGAYQSAENFANKYLTESRG